MALVAAMLSIPVGVTTVVAGLLHPVRWAPFGVTLFLGAFCGICASGVMALLWSKRFSRINRALVRSISTGSLQNAERQNEELRNSVLADISEAWYSTLQALQGAYQDKQGLATQHYTTLTELMRMLAKAVDERAVYLRGHSQRVSDYAEMIARELGIHPIQAERIRLSALIHDIGTLGIDDHIMTKDATLNAEEFDVVKAHPLKGAAILRPIEALHDLIPGVEAHHEALDGSGYPFGLRSQDIPLMARIIAVADSFDAMTTWRPYQSAMDPLYTLEVMERLTGSRYDPRVVAALSVLVRRGSIVVPDTKPIERAQARGKLLLVR